MIRVSVSHGDVPVESRLVTHRPVGVWKSNTWYHSDRNGVAEFSAAV